MGAFSVVAPETWNQLSANLRLNDCLKSFMAGLKSLYSDEAYSNLPCAGEQVEPGMGKTCVLNVLRHKWVKMMSKSKLLSEINDIID